MTKDNEAGLVGLRGLIYLPDGLRPRAINVDHVVEISAMLAPGENGIAEIVGVSITRRYEPEITVYLGDQAFDIALGLLSELRRRAERVAVGVR